MSAESYIDIVRPRLVENSRRARRVEAVIGMLRLIVRNHARFDDDSEGSPMKTVPAHMNSSDPEEIAWFGLYGKDGEGIKKAHTADMTDEDRSLAVGRAGFMLCSDDVVDQTVFTITTEPPDVLNYEGKPLALSEINGVIGDIQRYGDALAAGEAEVAV